MVQSPYNVTKMDSVSVSQGSPVSLAMNVLLDLKETNVINVNQNFMDIQIAKVRMFRNFPTKLKLLNDLFLKLVNVMMKDQRTKHVTKMACALVLLMWMETNALDAVMVTTHFQNV